MIPPRGRASATGGFVHLRMRIRPSLRLYELCKDDEIVSPMVGQIAWSNHLVVMARAATPEERRFCLGKCPSERWSKRRRERTIGTTTESTYPSIMRKNPPRTGFREE
ncbi:MAG: hypothetical protein IJ783_02260 [Kiritimatiellae bacterium]|nr:hypothetical protein [Kiritimatiellia bacterium]